MLQLVQDFTKQLTEALEIGEAYTFKTPHQDFRQVVITGLGGSGIGGSIIQNYVAPTMKVPFLVNKDYSLPGYVNEGTLVIISSYSGNTEETLSAMKQAVKAKATVVCVTSGGEVAKLAKKHKLDCIIVPPGDSPRANLGYSIVQVLFVLAHFGYIKNDFINNIKDAIALLDGEEKSIYKEALKVAGKLFGKMPIIYADASFEGVAIRFRQQLNENSKMLAWHGVVPEMNHNELLGWRDVDAAKAVIFLRNETDFSRNQVRMELSKKVIKKYGASIIELQSKGNSYWERVFYFIHLTDYISVELARLRNQDAVEIGVINFLKGELGKV